MSSKPRSSGEKSAFSHNKEKNRIDHLQIQDFTKQKASSLENIHNDNLEMVKDLQNIIQNCSNLSRKEIWDYCKSQRYFMKLYLEKLNSE